MSTGPSRSGFSSQGCFTWWTRITKMPRKSKVPTKDMTVKTRYVCALRLLILRNASSTDTFPFTTARVTSTLKSRLSSCLASPSLEA